MKNIKPFGPSIGKTKISKKFLDILNKEIDYRDLTKKNDYSSKLASQIKKEVKISNNFIKKNLEREIKKNIKDFLKNEKIKKVKDIKILNLWVVSQFKNEYNPIHYHGQRGFLSRSIFNIVPKDRDLLIFPNYLMHTAYPFNINSERRSFSFNAKIIFKK